jgi:aromatic-L-amino-acid decarboxylase
MSIDPHSLSHWDPAEIRRVAHRVADMLADYLADLPGKPVFTPVPPDLAERFRTDPVPREGCSPDAVLDQFEVEVAPYPFGNGHPRFWGWVNSPPAVMGIFADALAAAMGPSVAGGNHAAVHVERQVIGWFRELIGLPPTGMGLLVSGGSTATLTALTVARHVHAGFDVRAEGLQGQHPTLVVYTSQEGHSCVRKACELLGIGSEALRIVPVTAAFQMDVSRLVETIERDRAAGLRPLAVVASAGTVNTGAIDPLDAIAEICRAQNIWLHVDGAYGGAAVLTARYRDALAALARADSVALDPHKWLYVPVEAGMVLVRDGTQLRAAFSLVPPYLRTDGDPAGVGGPPWFSEYGFQQSRGFRALKVWMALKYYGVAGYTSAIDHDLDLAAYLTERVERHPDLTLMAPPSLSIVCFRYQPAGQASSEESAEEEMDALNTRLLARLQLGGRAFVSSTVLNGRFVLRACIVNPLSAQEDIDALIDAVIDCGSAVRL